MKLVVRALQDQDTRVRQKAAEALGVIGHARAVKTLGTPRHGQEVTSVVTALGIALKDRDICVREKAVEALKKVGHVHGVEVLGATLQDPAQDIIVRQKPAVALAEGGGSRGVEVLAYALGDALTSVRRAAVLALGEMHYDVRVFEPLAETLNHDGDIEVRCAAADALRRQGATKGILIAIAGLRGALKDERDDHVRSKTEACLRALIELRDRLARSDDLNVRTVEIQTSGAPKGEKSNFPVVFSLLRLCGEEVVGRSATRSQRNVTSCLSTRITPSPSARSSSRRSARK
ncbi:MAG: HEAT repeat domain-containing protein [Planctomycetes bacterium]|nr:HEAT repeat domain-containing protein [Planctomycetota bacterium]